MARRIVGLMCLGALLAASDVGAGSGQRRLRLKTMVDATVTDLTTGADVALLGFVRVQARVKPLDETIDLRATIVPAVFFASAGGVPPDLGADAQHVRELKAAITALVAQIQALEQELEEAANTDTEPLIPGTQVDKARVRDLQRRINELSAELKRLVEELKDLQRDMEARTKELLKQQEPLLGYRAFGTVAMTPSRCSGLACERLLSFALARPDGSSSPFQMRLRLQLGVDGRLVSDDTEPACETTLVCGVDAGECFCP